MKNKILLIVIAIGFILLGLGLGRLFTPTKVVEVLIESKYKRIDDSLRQVITEDSLIIYVLYMRVRNADSISDLERIKYEDETKKVKRFTPTTRINYFDSMFRAERLGNLPIQ